MKNLKKPKPLPNNLRNQFLKIKHDTEFKQIFSSFRKKILKQKRSSLKEDEKDIIKKFILKKKLPLNWVKPLSNYIVDGTPDYPLENGLSMNIGGMEITNKPGSVSILERIDDPLPDHKKISIEISAKINTDRIIRFIKEMEFEIIEWQKFLELPETGTLSWKRIDFALEIIDMKDKKNMTFGEISSKLIDDVRLTDKAIDYFSNESNIKSLYYRYKKRLGK